MVNTNNEQPHTVFSDRRARQDEKKAARRAEMRQSHYKKIGKRIAFSIVGLAIVFGGGRRLLTTTSSPKGADHSRAIEVLGRQHIQDGSSFSGYNSNPPTSGPHFPNPAQTGFYENELPDEQVVHNLEHGHVWIAYKPGLPEEAMHALRDLSGGNVIVTLRSKNDTDIAVAAWGRLDTFNLDNGRVDTQRIQDFISRYQNHGPENPSGFNGHLQ